MSAHKFISACIIALLCISSTYAAYPEISCDTDPVFAENACNQCFEGGSVSVGDNLGLLTDELLNEKLMDVIVYKEEQKMPYMINLSGASWSQTPSTGEMWEYTSEFNNLYSEEEDGYLVAAGSELTWLQSKLGYAYTLDTNTSPVGSNIGLLVYQLKTHDVSSDGDITIETDTHNECVLFNSGDTSTTPTPPVDTPKELPETGAEHILLIILALLLGFGLLKFTRKA